MILFVAKYFLESFRCWFNKLSVSHGLDHNQRWDSVRNCNEQRYLQHLEKTIWNVQLSHVKFSYMTIYDMFCMRNVYIITLACKDSTEQIGAWRDYIWRHKMDWRRLPWHFFWIYFSISSLQLLCVMISHWLTVLKHKMLRQILLKSAAGDRRWSMDYWVLTLIFIAVYRGSDDMLRTPFTLHDQ